MKSKFLFKVLLCLAFAYLTTSQGTAPPAANTTEDTSSPGTAPPATNTSQDTSSPGTAPPTTTTAPDTSSPGTAPPALTIVTGPIIGKVTTTTARVLIEFNAAAPITLILTDPMGVQFSTERTTTASVPVVFTFEGLTINTRYVVTLSDPTIVMVPSYFSTLSGISGKLNFGVISCMERLIDQTKEPQADLWSDMLKRVQNGEITYLIQMGDQAYMDDSYSEDDFSKPYFTSMNILNTTPRDQWESKAPQILESIRNEYRLTWNLPYVRETLAKVPSLMVMDDHEIRDDWGYLPQDIDPNTPDYYYGNLARQVYYEYQTQLRIDIDFNNISNITQDYFYEILNDIGFFFLDYRGVRTWNRNYSQMGASQLGATQTQLLYSVFNPYGGAFSNLTNAFLVSPLAVVFLVEKFTHIGYFGVNDVQESWTFKYGEELVAMLNLLRNWKIAMGGREVTILCGDVHMGGYTNIIYDRRDYAFLQFIASSIASSAPSDAAFSGFNLIKEVENLINPWSYEHHDWTNKYNYGIVIARNEGSQAKAECFLVEASDDESPTVVDEDGDSLDESDWIQILAGN